VAPSNRRVEDGPLLDLASVDCAVTASHTEVSCRAPAGAGHGFVLTIDVGQQQSAQFSNTTLRYMRPSISSVHMPLRNASDPSQGVESLDTRGGAQSGLVTIEGSNLGPASLGPQFVLASYSAQYVAGNDAGLS